MSKKVAGPVAEAARRPGRPPKFDAAALVVIERIGRENPTSSLGELVDRVEAATGVRAGEETLMKRLAELGFVRVVSPRKPPKGVAALKPAAPSPPGGAPAVYGYGPEHREKAPEALYPHGLGDAEWALVADLFEDKVRGTPRKYSRRSMVDAMVYVVRGGVPWRMLPHEFPPWHMVYKTFRRWSRQGRFEQMYDRLRRMWREREGRAAEPTGAVIDAQSVKTSA